MATTTRGVPYPLGTDANNTAGDLSALAQWVNDRPGVAALTTTDRNALTGVDRWDGKLVLDTTLDRLFRWDAGLAQWVQLADFSEIAALLASTGTPAAMGTASRGVSTSAARADHVHPSADSDAALTFTAGVNDTGSRAYLRNRQVTLVLEFNVTAAWSTGTTPLFTVPAAYRPPHRFFGAVTAAGVRHLLKVETAGDITLISGTTLAAGGQTLGTICYPAI